MSAQQPFARPIPWVMPQNIPRMQIPTPEYPDVPMEAPRRYEDPTKPIPGLLRERSPRDSGARGSNDPDPYGPRRDRRRGMTDDETSETRGCS